MSKIKSTPPNPWPALWQRAQQENLHLIGVDEAGRGPLFGPVVAGAVYLGQDASLWEGTLEGLACSKTLSEKKRETLDKAIRQYAPACAVAECTSHEIDRINILQASLLAMHRAVEQVIQMANLDPTRCWILVDGNRSPQWPYQSTPVVKGDFWVPAISAGSILAKVHRDRWCKAMAVEYPQYELDRHMGYPTPRHLELIRIHGVCAHHRQSFKPVKDVATQVY